MNLKTGVIVKENNFLFEGKKLFQKEKIVFLCVGKKIVFFWLHDSLRKSQEVMNEGFEKDLNFEVKKRVEEG